MKRVRVKHGGGEGVRVVPARTVRVVVRRGERATATATGLPREVEGPLPARTRLGTLVVRRRGHGGRPRAARDGDSRRAQASWYAAQPLDDQRAGAAARAGYRSRSGR